MIDQCVYFTLDKAITKSQDHSKENLNFLKQVSNPTKLSILRELIKNEHSISYFARKTGLTIPGIKKHIEGLENAGMIQRSSSRYSISSLGRIVLASVNSFSFISKCREYLNEHAIELLPPEFIYRFGELKESRLITGQMRGWETSKRLACEAEKEYFCMADQAAIPLFEFIVKKASSVKYHLLLDEETTVPKDLRNVKKRIHWDRYVKQGLIEEKVVHSKIILVINEKEALVTIPHKDNTGIADTTSCLLSSDENFCKWCRDLFRYFWEKGSPFDDSKFKYVP